MPQTQGLIDCARPCRATLLRASKCSPLRKQDALRCAPAQFRSPRRHVRVGVSACGRVWVSSPDNACAQLRAGPGAKIRTSVQLWSDVTQFPSRRCCTARECGGRTQGRPGSQARGRVPHPQQAPQGHQPQAVPALSSAHTASGRSAEQAKLAACVRSRDRSAKGMARLRCEAAAQHLSHEGAICVLVQLRVLFVLRAAELTLWAEITEGAARLCCVLCLTGVPAKLAQAFHLPVDVQTSFWLEADDQNCATLLCHPAGCERTPEQAHPEESTSTKRRALRQDGFDSVQCSLITSERRSRGERRQQAQEIAHTPVAREALRAAAISWLDRACARPRQGQAFAEPCQSDA